MIIAHHLICTAYGWWLANDPRGSTSLEIRVESLAVLGPLHYGRKEVQPPSRVIREFYDEAGDFASGLGRQGVEGVSELRRPDVADDRVH